METLQVKLHDAERKLSLSSSTSSQSPRQSPSKVRIMVMMIMPSSDLDQDDPVTVTGPRLTQRPDEEVRGLVSRLMAEEDILRRDQMEMTSNLGDKVNTTQFDSSQGSIRRSRLSSDVWSCLPVLLEPRYGQLATDMG